MVTFEPVHIKLKNLFRDETPQLQVVKSNLHNNNNNKKKQDDFVLSRWRVSYLPSSTA